MNSFNDPPLPEEPERKKPTNSKGYAKTRNRFEQTRRFVNHSVAKITKAKGASSLFVVIWFILWDYERSGQTRMAQSQLAQLAGCSPRQVRRAIAWLESNHYIKTIFKGGLNRGPSILKVLNPAQDERDQKSG